MVRVTNPGISGSVECEAGGTGARSGGEERCAGVVENSDTGAAVECPDVATASRATGPGLRMPVAKPEPESRAPVLESSLRVFAPSSEVQIFPLDWTATPSTK